MKILIAILALTTPLLAKDEVGNLPRADILATLDHLEQLSTQNQAKLTQAQQNITLLGKSLTDAHQNIVTLNKDIDALKAWGTEEQARADKAEAALSKTIAAYHRLKLICSIIAALAALFFSLRFMATVAPPYNLLIPIAATGAGAALIWIFF